MWVVKDRHNGGLGVIKKIDKNLVDKIDLKHPYKDYLMLLLESYNIINNEIYFSEIFHKEDYFKNLDNFYRYNIPVIDYYF